MHDHYKATNTMLWTTKVNSGATMTRKNNLAYIKRCKFMLLKYTEGIVFRHPNYRPLYKSCQCLTHLQLLVLG